VLIFVIWEIIHQDSRIKGACDPQNQNGMVKNGEVLLEFYVNVEYPCWTVGHFMLYGWECCTIKKNIQNTKQKGECCKRWVVYTERRDEKWMHPQEVKQCSFWG